MVTLLLGNNITVTASDATAEEIEKLLAPSEEEIIREQLRSYAQNLRSMGINPWEDEVYSDVFKSYYGYRPRGPWD